jgi:hypothetical protein
LTVTQVAAWKFGRLALLGACLTACNGSPAKKASTLVDIDAWWSFDYASNVCERASQTLAEERDAITQSGCDVVTACPETTNIADACRPLGSRPLVVDFFAHLKAQLASNAECDGVTITVYEGPNTPSALAAAKLNAHPDFELLVDYMPGSSEQSWSLQAEGKFLKGEGDVDRIATAICKITSKRGANIQN